MVFRQCGQDLTTFQTLILTILEQQVSLASAYAAFKKLKEKVGVVTPCKNFGIDR